MRGAPSFAKRAPPRIAYSCHSEHLTVIPSAVEESETDVSALLNMTFVLFSEQKIYANVKIFGYI